MPTAVKLSATVMERIAHGDDVYSLRLAPRGKVPGYQPGQFLHLALDAYDPSSHWPESRVFSIATSPTRASELRVTFAVKGVFTRRMASALRPGDVVWLKLPYGDFIVHPDQTNETVLLAGGTGITPFVALLESLLDRRLDVPLKLFYGARKPSLLLYRDLIEACVKTLPRCEAVYYVESSEGASDGSARAGRLSIDDVFAGVSQPLRADYYLSGPPQMITACSSELLRRGVGSSQLHTDAWE